MDTYTVPEQPPEYADNMLGGDLCVWAYAREDCSFNDYVTPPALAIFGDKLWGLGERQYTDEYKTALAEYLFGDAEYAQIFRCVGDIIPPRTNDRFTYLTPNEIDKALVSKCITMLRRIPDCGASEAYIRLLTKIADNVDTASAHAKPDTEA